MENSKKPNIALALVKHPSVWGGVGMIIRGGRFYGPLGVLLLGFGVVRTVQARRQ